jgi:short-subunit dehydrogenase
VTSGARVLVVTGASSGIGRAVALQSAAAGDHVVLVARGEPPLQQVARECEAAGAASTLVLPTDVGDDAEVEKLVTAVMAQHGRLDAVINCAGVVAYGRTEEVPVDVFEGVLRTNLTGAVNVARHVIPVLRRQREGSLVLFGSVIGHISVPGMSAYVLSKWGVRSLARQLQLENRDLSDVTIAYVAPGGVDTPIYEQAANYDGFAGRPPPPVLSPERVARITLRRLDNHRARTQIGVANDLMRFGFNAVPWAFDMLVGPLFRVMASDRTTRVEPTEGNVLESNFTGNQLHGAQGNALIGLGRNVVARLTGKDASA